MRFAMNEVLKASKKPLSAIEAEKIENDIFEQVKSENESKRLMWIAQEKRLSIQSAMGFSADDYYRFLRDIL
jgi:hypothetical protein